MGELPDEYFAPPYYETIGIEIRHIDDGFAVGELTVDESVSATTGEPLAHGGAVASLADAVGYWAASSAAGFAITPTIDLRIDYLQPATDDLRAEATVTRQGDNVGSIDIDIELDDQVIATARGVFKMDGDSDGSPWDPER
jgi:uncharacterized protein (TIGR00369 family)